MNLEESEAVSLTLSHYQIISQLYESRHSLVCRGYRVIDNRPVILKVLREEFPNPERLAWFRREFELTRSLKLPGVVEAIALIQDSHYLAIVLEDFGGASLAQLAVAGTFEVTEFLKLAIAIVRALGDIHWAQVVHKDINPSNIVWNQETDCVKIIDFGLSTVLLRENLAFSNPGQLQGTLAYLAPEQTGRMNRAIDYRTDFYALGVTFYELLVGHLPFQHGTGEVLEWIHSHIAKQPIPPHQVIATLPRAISDIVMKLMAKNAEDRYQSADGLQADLEFCLEHWERGQWIPIFSLARQDLSGKFMPPEKLYGREVALDTLLATFNQASQGPAELLLVSGYSGVGKSALVREVHKPITVQQGLFIAGKYDPYRRNIPYSAFVQALNELCQYLLSESEIQLALWRDRILTAVGGHAQVLIDVIPNLVKILGEQAPIKDIGLLDAQTRFNRTFVAFIQVICRPSLPLVIFLDDLQWADNASLSLLEALLVPCVASHLLIIGTYRSNEVDEFHPLRSSLNAVKLARGVVSEIQLNNLALNDVEQLVSDTLHCHPDESRDLAHTIYSKTQGNAFFTLEFLRTLYSEKLIQSITPTTDSNATAIWQWDKAKIQAKTVSNNVVDLLVARLEDYPSATQKLLQWSACIGLSFDLNLLSAVVQQTPSEILSKLWVALQSGFIVPLGDQFQLFLEGPGRFTDITADKTLQEDNLKKTLAGLESLAMDVRFRFQHDRIHQAAYSLIPEDRKQACHVLIGQLLLNKASITERDNQIFEIVNQLDRGMALIEDLESQIELAELNAIAGQKALATGAYAAAENYCQSGITLLPENRWQVQYELALKLHELAAELAYLRGNFERQEQLSVRAITESRSLLDCTTSYDLRIQSRIAQNQMNEAVLMAQQFLAQMGVTFPKDPQPSDFQAALIETLGLLGERAITGLIHLPEMIQPEPLAILQILNSIHTPIYMTAPALFPLSVFKQVSLSLEHGNAPLSATAYGYYGLILCGIVGDIKTGYQFGRLALELLELFQGRSARSATLLTVGAAVAHWQEPLRESIPLLRVGFDAGRESGDLQSAGFCLVLYSCHSYFSGRLLVKLEDEIEQSINATLQLNQQTPWRDCLLYRQVVRNWIDYSEYPDQLNGEFYNESEMLARFADTQNLSSAGHLWINKLILAYGFSVFDRAAEYGEIAVQYLPALTGTVMGPLFYFYDALTLLAHYPNLSLTQQEKALERVADHEAKLLHWSGSMPANYEHKYQLVVAEKAKAMQENWQASQAYEKAIAGARENAFLQEEALACELAAQFFLGQGIVEAGNSLLKKAHHAYRCWGAIAKVRQLEERYPYLLLDPSDGLSAKVQALSLTTQQSESLLARNLDVASIVKASQALAGEIELQHLLVRLMEIVLENAAADRGCLLLERQGQWVIEASGTVAEGIQVLQSLPIEGVEAPVQWPISLVRYVIRTQESVVLQDTTAINSFTQDPYILKIKPHSILCFPLIYQGKLDGVVYLENGLTTGAFSADRVEVLNILSSQAAISIENAKLYDHLKQYSQELEQKVAERTSELERLNRDLHNLATVDALTQVANRRQFDQYLQQEWGRAHREREPLTLVLCDVDYFKKYNDFYGHQSGDSCLQQVAHVLSETVSRATDLVARYGGEEFAIILPNTLLGGAAQLIESIQNRLRTLKIPHEASGIADYVTMSLGVSCAVPNPSISPESLIAAADRALYQAKDAGRNTYRVTPLI